MQPVQKIIRGKMHEEDEGTLFCVGDDDNKLFPFYLSMPVDALRGANLDRTVSFPIDDKVSLDEVVWCRAAEEPQ